jgi:hypothetical protein
VTAHTRENGFESGQCSWGSLDHLARNAPNEHILTSDERKRITFRQCGQSASEEDRAAPSFPAKIWANDEGVDELSHLEILGLRFRHDALR